MTIEEIRTLPDSELRIARLIEVLCDTERDMLQYAQNDETAIRDAPAGTELHGWFAGAAWAFRVAYGRIDAALAFVEEPETMPIEPTPMAVGERGVW